VERKTLTNNKQASRTNEYNKIIMENWKQISGFYIAGELLIPDGIIRQVVSVSSLTWFIRDIFVIEIYNS